MKAPSHFSLNKIQRNGILFFWFLILLVFLGIYFQDYIFPIKETTVFQDAKAQIVNKKIDSLKAINEKEKFEIYPFNPNYITDYKGYTLGMSVKEIDRLHSYRESGKWINSVQDFKKVTQVSDSLLDKISLYFKFPDWVNNSKKKTQLLPNHLKKDLNTATLEDLISVNGIGGTLATRIIRYRTKIDGFIDNLQIKDIYGLPYEAEQNLLYQFSVKNKEKPKPININSATIIQLSEIPYFDYELARAIINYRKLNKKIINFEELIKIDGFPGHKIDRIQLYLTVE